MEFVKEFSSSYANAVSAITALLTFFLAFATLWFLKREYKNKYRPYVLPEISIFPILGNSGYGINVLTRNVGPHPCEFMLSKMRLNIGDESYDTPSFKEWVLISPQVMAVAVPAGHVNAEGIRCVREGRYKSNRIDVSLSLHARSVDRRFELNTEFSYEINVEGDTPFVAFRPD